MVGRSKASAKASANMHDRDKQQALRDRELILQNQAKLAQYREATEEIKQQLQAQYEQLKSLGFPKARTEDERLKNFWLLVKTRHPGEAQQHYRNPVELENKSDRIQSTISKHSASSAPRASANSSPSPYHNRPSASARPSAQPSGIIDKNYLNHENWTPIGNYMYKFVDPDNGYTEKVTLEKYKKIMKILPP
jgi:hypothetical protein